MSRLVRFFALLRIKPHAPPLVRAPVNSFEFQPCGRTPRAECLMRLLQRLKGGNPPTLSTHRLRRGLPGYLILFAPHAFEPRRQLQTGESPSPLVFLHISTHFTATHGIPLSSSHSSSPVSNDLPRLSRGFHIRLKEPLALALRPINPDNACHLRITAAGGT